MKISKILTSTMATAGLVALLGGCQPVSSDKKEVTIPARVMCPELKNLSHNANGWEAFCKDNEGNELYFAFERGQWQRYKLIREGETEPTVIPNKTYNKEFDYRNIEPNIIKVPNKEINEKPNYYPKQ